MDWEVISAVGEILGAMGVISTLGYLAVQIRQNTIATRMSTAQQMTDRWVSINLHQASNPSIASKDFGPDLSEEERQAALAFWRAIFHQWANNHYQFKRGALDAILFQPTEREIAAYASGSKVGPRLRIAWTEVSYIYNDEFCKFMDDVLAANPARSRKSSDT